MTDEQIVAKTLKREGWPKVTNDPVDLGRLTVGGITYIAGLEFIGREIAAEDFIVWARDRTNATAFYMMRHIRPFDGVPDPLRLLVIDLGILRGVRTATMMLQIIVDADVDGWIGPQTLGLVKKLGAKKVNNLLAGARLHHIAKRIEESPSQVKWKRGWRNRTLDFYVD